MARVPLFRVNDKILAPIPVGRIGIIAALTLVLRLALSLPRRESVHGVHQQRAAQFRSLFFQFGITDALRHIDRFLYNNIAAIQLLVHQVDGHAGALVAQAEGPEEWFGTTVSR